MTCSRSRELTQWDGRTSSSKLPSDVSTHTHEHPLSKQINVTNIIIDTIKKITDAGSRLALGHSDVGDHLGQFIAD